MNECNKYHIKLDSKLLTVSLRKDGATVIYLFALALRRRCGTVPWGTIGNGAHLLSQKTVAHLMKY